MPTLILSTGNIVSKGPSILHKAPGHRSNHELTTSLATSFLAAKYTSARQSRSRRRRHHRVTTPTGAAATNQNADAADSSFFPSETSSSASISPTRSPPPGQVAVVTPSSSTSSLSSTSTSSWSLPTFPIDGWTERIDDTLYVPRLDTARTSALQEESTQYDITLKLFFPAAAAATTTTTTAPPASIAATRLAYAREALSLVHRHLGVPAVDLLIASFPGISFDGVCDRAADSHNAAQGNLAEELATWQALDTLHTEGLVRRLGVADFGSAKLRALLAAHPRSAAVNQINIRNCCKVPQALADVALAAGVELLVHRDLGSSDMLPPRDARDILADAGVLAALGAREGKQKEVEAGEQPQPQLQSSVEGEADVEPLWVVRYTAVVKDRGVIESKGYFASVRVN